MTARKTTAAKTAPHAKPSRTPAKTTQPAAKTPVRKDTSAPKLPKLPKLPPAPKLSKLPKAPKSAKVPKAAKPSKAAKAEPLVRDSFTMPQADYALIDTLKQRALVLQRPTKKSELLRAGLQALATLDDTKLRTTLNALVALKPGRRKKSV
jgi:hypothetical protein